MVTLRRRAGVEVLLVCAAATALLSGCRGQSTAGPATVVTVTVPPSIPQSSASGASGTGSTAPTPSTSVDTGHMSALPGRCDGLMPLASVVNVLGKKIGERTAFVVGLPDKDTGRVTYINCQYDVAKGSAPAVEIQVSLYGTATQAAARIRPTVQDYENNGATATQTTVDGLPATVLIGGTGAGYGPTAVLAAGQRTVAVSIRPGVVTTTATPKTLELLAALALERTSRS